MLIVDPPSPAASRRSVPCVGRPPITALTTVSAWLGHATPQLVLSRYGHHAPADHLRQALGEGYVFNGFFFVSSSKAANFFSDSEIVPSNF